MSLCDVIYLIFKASVKFSFYLLFFSFKEFVFITGYNNLYFIIYPGLEKFSYCSTCSALDGFPVLQLNAILASLYGATVTNSQFAHLHFHSALCSGVTSLHATTAKVNS